MEHKNSHISEDTWLFLGNSVMDYALFRMSLVVVVEDAI